MIKHLGKFEGELYATKYAYEATLDGCCDDLGESDGFGWYARFSDKIKGRGPFHIILNESSQGFVSGTYYDTETDLDAAWADLETEYADYCEQREGEQE